MSFQKTVEQPVIRAERFALRPIAVTDVGLLDLYAGDERVAWNTTTIPHPLPPGASQAYIERAQAADRVEDVWVMDGEANGLGGLLGVISLVRLDREQSEIGYWVVPAFWNSGIASEAVDALVAANPQASKTIFAAVFQDNPASARVLTHAGFDYLGDAEAYSVARGAVVPTWTYLRRQS